VKFVLSKKNYHIEDVSQHPTRENLIKAITSLATLLWEIYGKTVEVNEDRTKIRIYDSSIHQISPVFDKEGVKMEPEASQEYIDKVYKAIEEEVKKLFTDSKNQIAPF